jgi:hypothetical protein
MLSGDPTSGWQTRFGARQPWWSPNTVHVFAGTGLAVSRCAARILRRAAGAHAAAADETESDSDARLPTDLLAQGRGGVEIPVVQDRGQGADQPPAGSRVGRIQGGGIAQFRVDAHAGHTETSLLLHLWPDAVRIDLLAAGNTDPLADLMPRLRRGGVAAVSPSGVLGDPTTAAAADGARIFAGMVADCVRRVQRWTPGPDGML